MPAEVIISWKWIDFDPDETKSKLLARLERAKAPMTRLDRAVYVIRLKPPFAIQYPKKFTPVLYIGEGDLVTRLNSHRNWTAKLRTLGFPFQLEVAFCCPRVKKNLTAYRDFEAHLLEVFFGRYESLPLKNSIHETKQYNHEYDRIATNAVLGPGSGTRHTWAIQPLSSNPFKAVFERTHRE